ncbi:MAG: DUF6440 family protein [Hydrogenoanaerobacterium sp.]
MTVENERFVKTYSQGTLNVCEIWVDRETGVNYLWRSTGNSGGLTPLLNSTGNPLRTPLPTGKEE